MNIEAQISRSAQAAVKALYGQEVPEKMIQLQKTKREFEGHLTLVVFPCSPCSRLRARSRRKRLRKLAAGSWKTRRPWPLTTS